MKFARETLPVVIDQDCATEDNILSQDLESGLCYADDSNNQDSETKALLVHRSKENVNRVVSEGQEYSDLENEEKQQLMPKGGQMPEVEREFEEEEEEEYDLQSDSRYTSSYVTENTEDSLTGVLDNRVRTC